jgi:hypothetical protein
VGDLYPDHAGEGLRRQIVQLGAVCRTPACLGAAIYQSQFCSESSPRNGPSFAARRPPHRRRARLDAGEGVCCPVAQRCTRSRISRVRSASDDIICAAPTSDTAA